MTNNYRFREKSHYLTSIENKGETMYSMNQMLAKKYLIQYINIGLLVTSILFNIPASLLSAEELSIKILEIVSDESIKGIIDGLNPAEYEKYKVVVYVKTDKWYIHPYERGGPGRSYATIKENGKWAIATVKREFFADYVAALVVRSDYQAPSTVYNLWTIEFLAIYKEEGKNRL
jgi:hypothetical protein